MMSKSTRGLRRVIITLAVFGALVVPAFGLVGLSGTAHAAVEQAPAGGCTTDKTFFGLVPWYKYLTLQYDAETKSCKITNFDNGDAVLGKTSPILLIAVAILEDLIRVAGLVAVGFIIYGGFQYLTSQGSPDDTKRAQQTIINALIGLVVALMAVGIVSFIGTQLGG